MTLNDNFFKIRVIAPYEISISSDTPRKRYTLQYPNRVCTIEIEKIVQLSGLLCLKYIAHNNNNNNVIIVVKKINIVVLNVFF